jgi:hypothetical protein
MKAFSPNNAPLHDAWLNPHDDEPWCDSCDDCIDHCGCDHDEAEVGE